ncbi:hypothetical protein DPMN_093812 [Dreissena polymorpha]|uniref:Uncharacterized protein n=1 Tax=Dreissena polymorpha TaxID=45954 RepID=A0A9D4L3M8_DREPO|nr:hypothetical protein DPMN_093812 [Dreissena polymorpha]
MPHGRKRKQAKHLEETLEDNTRFLQPDQGSHFIDFEDIVRASNSVPLNSHNEAVCGVSGQSVPTLSLDLTNNLGRSLNTGQTWPRTCQYRLNNKLRGAIM